MQTVNRSNLWGKGLLCLVVLLCFFAFFTKNTYAATGINQTINFQGKLVNPDGTNVTDSTYSIVFSLYTVSSGGANVWTETDSVTTKDGVFRVALGSTTSFSGFNFNQDTLWLGIKVASDAEMTPRVQFASVPYAFNAQTVGGLTVTNTTGTLTVPNGTTISFAGAFTTSGANALTLTTTGTTNATLPSGTVTLVDLASSQSLTNKTYNGLTLASAGDGFTVVGGTVPRTLTVTGANITVGSTIQPTSAGALIVQANGSNALTLTGGAASTWSIGSGNALTLTSSSIQVTSAGVLSIPGANGTADITSITAGNGLTIQPLVLATAGTTGGALVLKGGNQTGTGSTLGGALTLDSGTGNTNGAINIGSNVAGSINIGTVGTAKTIAIGGTAGDTIQIGASATTAKTITIGNTGVATTLTLNTGVTAGTGLSIVANGANSGKALNISATGLTTGIGFAIQGGTAVTTGGDLDINGATYIHTAAETGNLAAFRFTDASTLTSGNSITTGLNVAPIINTSGAGTKTINAINAAAPTITGCATGACTLNGLQINTLTAGASSLITSNGINIVGTGIGSGALNGINIGAITGGAGTEYALEVGSGWDRGLDVNSPAQIGSTLTATGATTIGSAGNTFLFDPAAGPTYTGTARPAKQLLLSAEYAGAVLTASGSATTNGSMTSDASPSATPNGNSFENYYMWTSTQTSLQDYTVAVSVTLPKDFSGWATGNAITIAFNTALTTNADNALDVYLYNNGDNTGSPVYFSTNNVSGTAKTWTTVNITGTQLTSGVQTWNSAGKEAVFYFKMHAKNTTNYVQVGDITLNYLGKF